MVYLKPVRCCLSGQKLKVRIRLPEVKKGFSQVAHEVQHPNHSTSKSISGMSLTCSPRRSGCAQTAQFLTLNLMSPVGLEILTHHFELITPPNLHICQQQLTQTCPFVHQTRQTNISAYADEVPFSWLTTGTRLCVQSGDTVMKTSSEIKLSANEKNFASAL